MSGSYDRVKAVPLKLKGITKPSTVASSASVNGVIMRSKEKEESAACSIQVPTLKLTGRIIVSGVAVQGVNTMFKEEVKIGDTIIIQNPQSHQREERFVVSIASNRALVLNEILSSDFVSTIEASIRQDHLSLLQDSDDESKLKKEVTEEGGDSEIIDSILKSNLAKRLETQKTHVAYLQKAGLGYRTVTEVVNKQLSRGDLLELRSRKVHDKYC